MIRKKLESHPGRLLLAHLEAVAGLCTKFFDTLHLNLSEKIPANFLRDFLYVLGFTHDFGKATGFFQNYIHETDESRRIILKNDPKTHHGALSAFFTFWIVKELIKIKYPALEGKGWAFYAFFIVKKHHGNLRDLVISNKSAKEIDFIDIDILQEQINTLYTEDFISKALNHLAKTLNFDIANSPLNENLNAFYRRNIRKSAQKFFREKQKKQNIKDYILFQLCYSILLQSDKQHAVFNNEELFNRNFINYNSVAKYKKETFKKSISKLDDLRKDISIDVLQKINKDLSKRILSLNAPTGTGKTLTGLEAALKLREKINKDFGFEPRIIYCLPFTSIIDQNFNVFSEVLNDPTSDILLKHHHLADLTYTHTQNDNDYIENKDPIFLIEGWESEIIVTTFVQLFHTLATNKNRLIRKFHKLANSIIILDEVQIIPHKFWYFTRTILSEITQMLHSYIILMTATQPAIFSDEQMDSLLSNKEHYFKQMNRITLNYEPEEIEFASFRQRAKEAIQKSDDSFLFVMNTVNASIELFEGLLKEKTENQDFFYLSTNITPKERLERIWDIKKKSNRQKIVVSTQMVEAGVDIDLDQVWRDFAPMDSINQVAGRCNRNNKGKAGVVRIFRIKHKKGRLFASFIYGEDGAVGLSKTRDILNEKPVLSEKEFLETIDSYYQQLKENLSNQKSEEILTTISEMKFSEIGEFSLIEEGYQTCDLFIELNEEARKFWEDYEDLKRNIKTGKEDFFEIQRKIKKIRRKLAAYIISVPKRYAKKYVNENEPITYISNIQLIDNVYHKHTGWQRDETTGSFVF